MNEPRDRRRNAPGWAAAHGCAECAAANAQSGAGWRPSAGLPILSQGCQSFGRIGNLNPQTNNIHNSPSVYMDIYARRCSWTTPAGLGLARGRSLRSAAQARLCRLISLPCTGEPGEASRSCRCQTKDAACAKFATNPAQGARLVANLMTEVNLMSNKIKWSASLLRD